MRMAASEKIKVKEYVITSYTVSWYRFKQSLYLRIISLIASLLRDVCDTMLSKIQQIGGYEPQIHVHRFGSEKSQQIPFFFGRREKDGYHRIKENLAMTNATCLATIPRNQPLLAIVPNATAL